MFNGFKEEICSINLQRLRVLVYMYNYKLKQSKPCKIQVKTHTDCAFYFFLIVNVTYPFIGNFFLNKD